MLTSLERFTIFNLELTKRANKQMSENQLSALQQVASRLAVSENELQRIVLNTVFPSNKNPTPEQFLSFMAVANEYHLNPLTKEIYAFPTQGGGIQPIVSIDGWLKIINTNPDFNGMTFEDVREEGKLIAITCSIYKKDILHPVQVTEYLEECRMNTQPWKKYPSRMGGAALFLKRLLTSVYVVKIPILKALLLFFCNKIDFLSTFLQNIPIKNRI